METGGRLSRVFLVAALLALTQLANASLIGDEITIDWLFPNETTLFATETVIVGAGPEVVCGAGPLCFFDADSAQFDITDFSISWTSVNHSFYIPTSFNGFLFRDLDFSIPGNIVGFALSTNMAGIDDSRVSFTDDSIRINLESGDLAQLVDDDFFTLRLIIGQPVAEPGSLALVGLGLTLIAGALRRKRSPR